MAKRNYNPLLLTQLQKLVGISPDEMQIPEVMNKLQDIAGFFSGMKEVDIQKQIRQITMGKFLDDKLSHVWSFCELNDMKNACEDELEDFEGSPEEKKAKKEELKSLSEQIDYYYE